MGNGRSLQRGGRNHHQGSGSRMVQSPPPAGYLPYYHPAGNYSQGYIQNNGQIVVNIQPSAYPHMISPPPAAVHLPFPDVENHKANTIKNDVNLKKSTLRLERDEENPGFYLVAFSFDAIVPGWICIFFLAKEGEQCSLNSIKPDLFLPVRIAFEKGLGQNFRQACGTGVDLSLFDECELLDEGNGEVFPLVVRTETVPKAPPLEHGQAIVETPLNAPLPKWVHAQTTHAVLEKKDNDYQVKVAKQIIYVEGVRYELQEIYGIENADGSDEGAYGNDCGKECVICLSELRDTTVLPCRHMDINLLQLLLSHRMMGCMGVMWAQGQAPQPSMCFDMSALLIWAVKVKVHLIVRLPPMVGCHVQKCMCSACAKVLRFQSSRCPICRTPVERLLEIKVSNKEQDKGREKAEPPD